MPDSEARSSGDCPQMQPPPDPHPEGRKVKVKRAPREPTQEERDRHNVSHCPFRSWCKSCVLGQSVSSGHFRARDDEEKGVPEVSMDYMYMGENQEDTQETMRNATRTVVKE